MNNTAEQQGGDSSKKNLHGLGGWLMLVGIGLFIGLIGQYGELSEILPGIKDSWYVVTSPQSPSYVEGSGIFLAFSITLNLISALLILMCIYFYFSLSEKFPLFYKALLAFVFIIAIVDFMGMQILNLAEIDDLKNTMATQIFASLIQLIIWGLYMTKSIRVKNTFTKKSKIQNKKIVSYISVMGVIIFVGSYYSVAQSNNHIKEIIPIVNEETNTIDLSTFLSIKKNKTGFSEIKTKNSETAVAKTEFIFMSNNGNYIFSESAILDNNSANNTIEIDNKTAMETFKNAVKDKGIEIISDNFFMRDDVPFFNIKGQETKDNVKEHYSVIYGIKNGELLHVIITGKDKDKVLEDEEKFLKNIILK